MSPCHLCGALPTLPLFVPGSSFSYFDTPFFRVACEVSCHCHFREHIGWVTQWSRVACVIHCMILWSLTVISKIRFSIDLRWTCILFGVFWFSTLVFYAYVTTGKILSFKVLVFKLINIFIFFYVTTAFSVCCPDEPYLCVSLLQVLDGLLSVKLIVPDIRLWLLR